MIQRSIHFTVILILCLFTRAIGQDKHHYQTNFSKEEFKELPFVMDKASEMILSFCTIGAAKTMSLFNS